MPHLEGKEEGSGIHQHRNSQQQPSSLHSNPPSAVIRGRSNKIPSLKRPADDEDDYASRPKIPIRPHLPPLTSPQSQVHNNSHDHKDADGDVPPMPLSKEKRVPTKDRQAFEKAIVGLNRTNNHTSTVSQSTTSTVQQKKAAAEFMIELDDEGIKAKEKASRMAFATSSTRNNSEPVSLGNVVEPKENVLSIPTEAKSSFIDPPKAGAGNTRDQSLQSANNPLSVIESLEMTKAREKNSNPFSSKSTKGKDGKSKSNKFHLNRIRRKKARREKEKQQQTSATADEEDTMKLAQMISLGNGPAYIQNDGHEGVDENEFDHQHRGSYDNDDDNEEEEEEEKDVLPGAFAVRNGTERERNKYKLDESQYSVSTFNSADRSTSTTLASHQRQVIGDSLTSHASTTIFHENNGSSTDRHSGGRASFGINPVLLTPPRSRDVTNRSEQSEPESPPGRAIAESPGSEGRLRPRGTLTVLASHYHASQTDLPLDKNSEAEGLSNDAKQGSWWVRKKTLVMSVVAMAIVIIVAIAVSVAMSGGGGGDRRSDIMDLLSDVLDDTALQRGTDQHDALDFIVEDDTIYSTLSNPDKVRQRYALAVFFYSTSGFDWTLQQNWLNSDVDECKGCDADECKRCDDDGYNCWKYIKCDRDGNVIDIYVNEKNDLKGSLPTELSILTSLVEFGINYNDVFPEGTIPSLVFGMTQLTSLTFEYTNLKGQVPSSLVQLSNLEFIFLQHNNFIGTIPDELFESTPPNLHWLDLSFNKLTNGIDEIIDNFNTLTNLRILQISDNDLDGTIPTTIGLIESLEQFWIDRNNDITGNIPSEIGQLTDLNTFVFSMTGITGEVPSEVCLLKSSSSLKDLVCTSNSCNITQTPNCCNSTDISICPENIFL